ncbi:MAG: hypothetical protein NVSMB56_01380 [Pyrinomonadaceae bacterium]
MRDLAKLTIESDGKILLPASVRRRYKLAENVPLRVIEARNGILLVPLTDTPMSAELSAELNEWQALGAESFEMFPYEETP